MGTESPSIVDALWPRVGSRRWRVFIITYIWFLLMITVARVGLSDWIKRHVKLSVQNEITRNLTQKAQLVANRINADRAHPIDVIASQEGQAAGARATVIDTNGQVVADSEVSVSSLQNEGRSPEFSAALRGSIGTRIRNSNGAEILFVALPVSGGAVRLACPISDVETLTAHFENRILLGCALAAAVALIVSGLLTWIIETH